MHHQGKCCTGHKMIHCGVGVVLAMLLALVVGFFIKVLWNWLMPELFGLPQIHFWQAWGLLILSRLLVGGYGHHKHPCLQDLHRKHDECHAHIKGKIRDWLNEDLEKPSVDDTKIDEV